MSQSSIKVINLLKHQNGIKKLNLLFFIILLSFLLDCIPLMKHWRFSLKEIHFITFASLFALLSNLQTFIVRSFLNTYRFRKLLGKIAVRKELIIPLIILFFGLIELGSKLFSVYEIWKGAIIILIIAVIGVYRLLKSTNLQSQALQKNKELFDSPKTMLQDSQNLILSLYILNLIGVRMISVYGIYRQNAFLPLDLVNTNQNLSLYFLYFTVSIFLYSLTYFNFLSLLRSSITYCNTCKYFYFVEELEILKCQSCQVITLGRTSKKPPISKLGRIIARITTRSQNRNHPHKVH